MLLQACGSANQKPEEREDDKQGIVIGQTSLIFLRWRKGSRRFRSTYKHRLQLRLLSSRWLFRSRSKHGRVRVNQQFLTSQIFCQVFMWWATFLLTLWCWHKKKNKYSPIENVVLIASLFVWLSFFIASFLYFFFRPLSGQEPKLSSLLLNLFTVFY